MPIGGQNNRVRITRIELRDGKFQEWVGQGQEPRTYDWVQGVLCGIATREQPMKDGNIFVYCDIHLRSDEGERFCISTIASSGITGDIISRLVNVKELTSVLVFSAWKNGNFTNIAIRSKKTFDANESEKISWVDIPRPKKVQVGFNTVMDSSERDTVVMRMIAEINAKLDSIGANALKSAAKEEVKNEQPPANASGYTPEYVPGDVPPPQYYP